MGIMNGKEWMNLVHRPAKNECWMKEHIYLISIFCCDFSLQTLSIVLKYCFYSQNSISNINNRLFWQEFSLFFFVQWKQTKIFLPYQPISILKSTIVDKSNSIQSFSIWKVSTVCKFMCQKVRKIYKKKKTTHRSAQLKFINNRRITLFH